LQPPVHLKADKTWNTPVVGQGVCLGERVAEFNLLFLSRGTARNLTWNRRFSLSPGGWNSWLFLPRKSDVRSPSANSWVLLECLMFLVTNVGSRQFLMVLLARGLPVCEISCSGIPCE